MICVKKDSANKKSAKNLSELLKKAEIQFVKNARHEVNIDAPKELAEILNKFYHR